MRIHISAVIPDIGELAWPVEFIVGKFHKKHVFIGGKAAPLKEASIALHQWTQKVKWNYCASSGLITSDNPWRFLHSKRPVMDCFIEVPEALSAHLHHVSGEMFRAFSAQRKRLIRWGLPQAARHHQTGLRALAVLGLGSYPDG